MSKNNRRIFQTMTDFEKYKKHSDLIWSIANKLRGPYRPPQYRRVMIPLTVLRRLDCVLEATKDKVVAMHKNLALQNNSWVLFGTGNCPSF